MFVQTYTRLECNGCGGVVSVLTSLDSEHYTITFCPLCAGEDIELFDEQIDDEQDE